LTIRLTAIEESMPFAARGCWLFKLSAVGSAPLSCICYLYQTVTKRSDAYNFVMKRTWRLPPQSQLVGFMYGTAREGRHDLPRLRQRRARIGRVPVLFVRYIYMRHMQLSRSCAVHEVLAGEKTGAHADSNAANSNTTHRLA